MNKSIRQICEDEEFAKKELGEGVASSLQNRLTDLIVANRISEVIVGNPEVVDEGYRINLSGDFYLFFCANHIEVRLTKDKRVDWSKVNRIKILRIDQNNV